MKYSIQKLQVILEKLRKSGKKISLCHGCFDGLHDGHIKLFQKAKNQTDIVVVGIEKDEYIKTVKGSNRPFYRLRDRIGAIAKSNLVDYIFVIPQGKQQIYKKLYLDIKPDYLVTAVDEVFQKKSKDVMGTGIKLILIKEKDHHSSNKSRLNRNAKT